MADKNTCYIMHSVLRTKVSQIDQRFVDWRKINAFKCKEYVLHGAYIRRVTLWYIGLHNTVALSA